MSRSKWSIVFGSLAALGLLLCQNAAYSDELEAAPQPSDAGGSAPAQKCCAEKQAACCPQQACDGEMCLDRHFIVDIDAVFLAPIQHQDFGNVAMGTANANLTALDRVTEQQNVQTQSEFVPTPRIALGIQGECWGFLTRYWRIQTGQPENQFANPDGVGTFSQSLFEAQTFDVEATRLIGDCNDDQRMRLSFGIRYAELREAGALTFDEVGPALGAPANTRFEGSVLARHDFSGFGPTIALQGVRRVNDSNFHLFYDLRASLMVDNNANNYVGARALYTGFGNNFVQNGVTSSQNLFIGEFQVGGQWDLPLKCIPANAFVRLAFEYQYWATTHGEDAIEPCVAGVAGGPAVLATAQSSGNTHIDLVGFNIGTGLTW